MDSMARDGFRVLAPDLLGHGGTSKPDLDYTKEDYIKSMDDFLEAVGLGGDAKISLCVQGYVLSNYALLWAAQNEVMTPPHAISVRSPQDAWHASAGLASIADSPFSLRSIYLFSPLSPFSLRPICLSSPLSTLSSTSVLSTPPLSLPPLDSPTLPPNAGPD